MFSGYTSGMSTLATGPAPETIRLDQTAVLVRRPLGVLHITGQTRLDLIDRMSTQKVRSLTPGQGTATVFTTDIGRIIDRVLLYAGEDKTIALTGEEYNDPLARYLMSYVFFGDDFHLQDRTADTAVLALYGASAVEALAAAGLAVPVDLPLHHWVTVETAAGALTLHRTDPLGGDGWFILTSAGQAEMITALLAGAQVLPIGNKTFERLRIEAGLPRFGSELTRDYIPLEAGLWDDISFDKGCYIGQEIIARMDSRGKLAKRLVRLVGDGPLAAGTPLTAGDKAVGTITSAAGEFALGYVKSAVLDENIPLQAGRWNVAVRKAPPPEQDST